MKVLFSKSLLCASVVLAVAGAHAGTQINVSGVQPGGNIDTLNVKGANPGTNILSVDNDAGGRVFNIDRSGSMFVTLGNTDKGTRLVLQNQQTGALETSGKLENQDTNVLGDASKMDFLVRETDANGVPTGGFGEISEEGMGNFVESLLNTNTSGGGIDWLSGSDLGAKLDGNTSTAAETLNVPVQDGAGNKGYISEAALVGLIEQYGGGNGGSLENGGTVRIGDFEFREGTFTYQGQNYPVVDMRPVDGVSRQVEVLVNETYHGAGSNEGTYSGSKTCSTGTSWQQVCATTAFGGAGSTGGEMNRFTIYDLSTGSFYDLTASWNRTDANGNVVASPEIRLGGTVYR